MACGVVGGGFWPRGVPVSLPRISFGARPLLINTILGVPYDNYSIMGPKTLF